MTFLIVRCIQNWYREHMQHFYFSPEMKKEQLRRCSLANLCLVHGQVTEYTLVASEPLSQLPPGHEYLGQGMYFGQTPSYLA